MPFKPKVVTNELSIELLTLRKELEATGLIEGIDSSTLLVYSALKSGITDSKLISESFYLSEKTVQYQMRKLIPVKYRILKLYKQRSTKLTVPIINISIQMLPDLFQEKIIEVPELCEEPKKTEHSIPIPPVSIPAKPVAPLSKKDKLKGFQM